MSSSQKRLELFAWLLVPIAPILFLWVPAGVFFGSSYGAGEDWIGIFFPALFAALPFCILAAFIRTENRRAQPDTTPVTSGLKAAFITTIVVMVMFYMLFWVSVINGVGGVNFGMIFLVMGSPFLIYPIICISYYAGVRFGKKKMAGGDTESG